MEIKKTLKKFDDLFLSHTSIIGFLTNFGLFGASLLFNIISKSYLNLSTLGNINLTFIPYLVLSILSYKSLLWGNKRFNAGFSLSFALVTILFISTYIRFFLGD